MTGEMKEHDCGQEWRHPGALDFEKAMIRQQVDIPNTVLYPGFNPVPVVWDHTRPVGPHLLNGLYSSIDGPKIASGTPKQIPQPPEPYFSGYDQPSEDYGQTERELQQLGMTVLHDLRRNKSTSIGMSSCCSQPPLCEPVTRWQAQWKGYPTFYINSWTPIYDPDQRALQADLNPIQYLRTIEVGREPNPYAEAHWYNRQMMAQMRMGDVNFAKDQYSQPIHSLATSGMVQYA